MSDSPANSDHIANFIKQHAPASAIAVNMIVWIIFPIIYFVRQVPIHKTIDIAIPTSGLIVAFLIFVTGSKNVIFTATAAVFSNIVILFIFIFTTGYRPGIGLNGPGEGFEPKAVAILTAGYLLMIAFALLIFMVVNKFDRKDN
ncbi:hypothetical protein [Mesorhizobium sp. J428]|uniref:hypothetical protein n=1 Tax=Mesorhizobium sp. J428 TaxID=2898440 RepID=UPI0021516A45|nr:hypothetical protein [Mesorhizobium sp. J428]MCR5855636.1 hypothetical protein [Mesorhizobium sp. J428]